MRDLFLDFINDPFLFIITFVCIINYVILTIIYSRKNLFRKRVEFVFIIFFLFCNSKVQMSPIQHWRLDYFVQPPQNELITYSSLLIYLVYSFTFLIEKKNASILLLSIFKSIASNPFVWGVSAIGAVTGLLSDTPVYAVKAGFLLIFINLFATHVSTQCSWCSVIDLFKINTSLICFLSLFIRQRTNFTTEGGGLAGITSSKNQLGSLAALGLILWLLTIDINKLTVKSLLIYLLGIGCTLYALIDARSGGAIVASITSLSFMVIIFFLKKIKGIREKNSFVSFLFAALLLIGIVMISNLEFFLGLIGKTPTLTGRTAFWPEIIEAAWQKQWIGYGLFGFWQSWRGPDNPALSWLSATEWIPPSAHQGFLDTWLQLGFLGLTILIISIVITCSQAVSNYFSQQNSKYAVFPLVLILFTLISNTYETHFLSFNFTWIAFVIISGKLSLEQKPSN
ncbi:hypothetical protein C8255_04020 [filamentous cyanobacterium CCP3]|nr:hypothetical protein C8255_04020 [filamentous cyanobacterium CCP3]